MSQKMRAQRDAARSAAAISGDDLRKVSSIEILLAKIVCGRYIAFASFIRYFDVRIALTTVKIVRQLVILLMVVGAASAVAGPANLELQPSPTPAAENSRDLFYYETTYTFRSDFEESKLGHGDSLYNDFAYDHRFHINGNWYFRAGIEYERYDFGGSDNGLPDHLQAVFGHLALDYVVKDTAGIGIEVDPGIYFQDQVSSDAIDIPGKAYVTFPLKKDKIFATVGFGWGMFQQPAVAPGGGITWLFTDKLRLQAVFPRPALVYQANDDWEFRAIGELAFLSARTDQVHTTEQKLQLDNALVQYSDYRAGLQIAYSGFKPFKIIAAGGASIRRNFDFFRAEQSKRTEPAPYIRIAAEAKF